MTVLICVEFGIREMARRDATYIQLRLFKVITINIQLRLLYSMRKHGKNSNFSRLS